MFTLESANFHKILKQNNLKLKIERLVINYSENVTDLPNADLSHSSENHKCRMVTSLNHPSTRSVEC